MAPFIFYEDKKVPAKGLVKQPVQEDKLQEYILPEDATILQLLATLKPLPYTKTEATLFYPGCGVDLLFPLFYLDQLFPNVKRAHLLFNDLDHTRGILQTILDDVGISFAEEGTSITFYWGSRLVRLEFLHADLLDLLPTLPPFDIYFEKAHRAVRESFPDYETIICSKLRKGGVLISDSGFQQQPLRKVAVPAELSYYQEMIIAIKE